MVIDMTNKNLSKDIKLPGTSIHEILKDKIGEILFYVPYGNVKVNKIDTNNLYNKCIELVDPKTDILVDYVGYDGRKYKNGEVLLFPDNRKNWKPEFEKYLSRNPYKPGDYIIADGRKCIYKEKTSTDTIELYVCIAKDTDVNPGEIRTSTDISKLIIKNHKIRLQTEKEIKETNDFFKEAGLKWNNDTKEFDDYIKIPKIGDQYYCLIIRGACEFIIYKKTWNDDSIDLDRFYNNNLFLTYDEAEIWLNKFNNATKNLSEQLKQKI